MQYKHTLAAASLATVAMAAYVPSEPWSTLSPNATFSGAISNYNGSFGIAVFPLATSTSSAAKGKRDAISQIGDGQIQAATTTTGTPIKTPPPAAPPAPAPKTEVTTNTAVAPKTVATTNTAVEVMTQATTVTNVAVKTEATTTTKVATIATTSTAVNVMTEATTVTNFAQQTTAKTFAKTVTSVTEETFATTFTSVTAETKTITPPAQAPPAPAANGCEEGAAAVSQITDGQVQATVAVTKPKACTPTTKPTVAAVPKRTEAAVSQIGDGQVQATTKAEAPTFAPTTTSSVKTETAVSQITDGQIQATNKPATTTSNGTKNTAAPAVSGSSTKASGSSTASTSAPQASDDSFFQATACKNNGTLTMNLKNGILTDEKGRIGSIVANRQFQFDGPPPQAGAIYAAGWSITPQGNLALGDSDVFYQCLSGNFYNIYDENQGAQCQKVYLQAVELTNC
ncbi:hypothetical protein TBLA_0J01310 [Henningerozyma blattae CBS 6284]|uniref:Cell wall mannoprotein PIR1-like C-terminal domain-containing protein n=1 Tax=Henningerozyma blattae (strain ATCC 34711 / CBS 6284 / DSM 70876 / NBRC 10599 / NRRL Y-10934 / UCD 77-7) TaxID=1071380 RepID=I2H9S5_HENB6|nr:hypothetical protein TBLA_0J01310 [Tetrapisispora blattae CBS 6284]CCH63127.1 hypothetical protein TBLA_0J01310 [Tetrapisispora blattae CBS 6284]